MSDISSLSHEYASSADFSRTLNSAVVAVKKQFARRQIENVEGEIANSIELIRHTLNEILARLQGPETRQMIAREVIPDDVFCRIVEEHRKALPHFKQDLNSVLSAFEHQTGVQKQDLEFLDTLCEAADASASATFRKLWRR